MNKSIEEFAKWLGLETGRRYKIVSTGEIILVDKDYNYYLHGEALGHSLNELSVYDALHLEKC